MNEQQYETATNHQSGPMGLAESKAFRRFVEQRVLRLRAQSQIKDQPPDVIDGVNCACNGVLNKLNKGDLRTARKLYDQATELVAM